MIQNLKEKKKVIVPDVSAKITDNATPAIKETIEIAHKILKPGDASVGSDDYYVIKKFNHIGNIDIIIIELAKLLSEMLKAGYKLSDRMNVNFNEGLLIFEKIQK